MKAQGCLLLMLALSCKPVHGNGKVEGAEQCDDGNALDGDGCNVSCELEVCGDGLINNGNLEQCDDGNTENDDGCSSVCRRERCGDGIVNNVKEQCDDDNVDGGDGCNSRCQFEFCGDGIVNNKTEACDDGNQDDKDGCRQDCQGTPFADVTWEFLPPQKLTVAATLLDVRLSTKDINKDGDLDLVVFDASDSPQVLLNRGNDTFGGTGLLGNKTVRFYGGASSGAFGDFNGDGQVEFFGSGYSLGAMVHSGGPSALVPYQKAAAFAAADLNKDGIDDAVVATEKELRLWFGSRDGLQSPSMINKERVEKLSVADFNGDTELDLVALNAGVVTFFFGSGGSFVEQSSITPETDVEQLLVGDINNDGASDVILGARQIRTIVYQSKSGFVVGDGPSLVFDTWAEAPIDVCDFNDDGNLDIAALEDSLLRVFLGTGKGDFIEKFKAPILSKSPFLALAAGDINKDGVCDLITAEFAPKLWLGQSNLKGSK